jgi:hypothetical protein
VPTVRRRTGNLDTPAASDQNRTQVYTGRMLRCRTLIVLLMSLWLPLQGVAAIVMPFCKHSLDAGAQTLHAGHTVSHTVADDHAGSDHTQHAAHAPDPATASLQPCDDCGHCQLSAASTLPAAELPASPPNVAILPASLEPVIAGVVPALLNRPPLLA